MDSSPEVDSFNDGCRGRNAGKRCSQEDDEEDGDDDGDVLN
jgi:hypothetical protein